MGNCQNNSEAKVAVSDKKDTISDHYDEWYYGDLKSKKVGVINEYNRFNERNIERFGGK